MELGAARIEAAEDELNRFIERRAKEREEADAEAEAWRESERRYHERQREENRRAWIRFHLDRAEGLERTAASLAAEHRARAAALLGGQGGSSCPV